MIKELHTNEYENYQTLVDKTMENIEEIINPVLIDYNDELALVCYLSNFYSIVSPSESVLIRKDPNGSVTDLIDEDYHYQVHLDSDIPIVSKVYNSNNNMEQLFLTPAKENEPRSFIHYYQGKSYGNGDELEMDYDCHNFENRINQFLIYSTNRRADIITLKLLKQFLMFQYKKNKSICYSENDRNYLECFDSKFGYLRFFGLGKIFNWKELEEYINSLGFNSSMNSELVELFLGTNKQFNDIELLSKRYDEFKRIR